MTSKHFGSLSDSHWNLSAVYLTHIWLTLEFSGIPENVILKWNISQNWTASFACFSQLFSKAGAVCKS